MNQTIVSLLTSHIMSSLKKGKIKV